MGNQKNVNCMQFCKLFKKIELMCNFKKTGFSYVVGFTNMII